MSECVLVFFSPALLRVLNYGGDYCVDCGELKPTSMLPIMKGFQEHDCIQAEYLKEKWTPYVAGRAFSILGESFNYTEIEVHDIEQKDKCYVVVLSTHTAHYMDLKAAIFNDPYLMAMYLESPDF